MDKDLIALFKVLKDQGIFESEDQMMQVIESEGIEVLYPAMPEGMFDDVDSFVEAFPGALKKKDESMVIGGEEDMDSTTPVEEEEVISSESSEVVEPEEGAVVGYEAGRRHRGQGYERERIASEREEQAREEYDRGYSVLDVPTREKDTMLERALGKNEVTDFFGDIWRAGAKGYETGNTVDEALELSLKGRSASASDIADFVRVNKRLQQTGPSDEMTAFNDAYEKAGGGAWGFISGLIAAPTSVVEIAVTSVSQMVNPAVAAGAGVGAGTGAAIGSTGFSAGPLGVFTTAGGAIAGALGGAGATLEAGLSFSEFLQEELSEKGLAFNEKNVAKVLNDDDAMFRIRSKSAGRGAVIGIVDGITAGVASKIAGGVGKTAIKAGKAAKRANLASKGVATAIEGVGGGIGEASARLAVGQDMDAAEIGFEAVGGAPGSVISAIRTTVGKGKYKMGPDGADVTFEQMVKLIEETDDATFAGIKLEIKGDEVLKEMATERKDLLKAKKAKAESIRPNLEGLSTEDKKAAVDLEVELDQNSSGLSRAKRNRKKEIETQLDEIYSRKGEVVDVGVEITSIDTRLNEINNQETFTEADIAEKNTLESRKADLQNQQTDAIQESSTTEVDVQEQAGDGSTVGDGDTARGVTAEGEGETTTTDQTTQEEIEPATQQEIEQGANDLGDLLGALGQVVEDNPVNLGDGASGRNRAEDQDQTGDTDVTTTEEIDQTTVEVDPNIQPDNNTIVVEDTDNQTVEVVQSVDKEGNRVTAPPRKGKRIKQGLTVVDNVEGAVDSYYQSDNYKTENPNQTPVAHEQRITRIADKALKAIQKVFPDVNIVLHRSDQSYKDHVSTESRGAYNSNTNTIHLNVPKADALTIAHEVFHAVLKNKLGFEGKIQDVSKRMLKRLKKVIKKSKNLTKEEVLALEDYASNFEGNIQNEEFLAEFVGFLSSTYKKLDAPAKSTVKEWVQSILDFIGLDINIGDINNDDRAVVDLLNVIAEKVATGEEITAQDLQALDDGGSINVGEPGPIQKAEEQAKRDKQFTEEQILEGPKDERPTYTRGDEVEIDPNAEYRKGQKRIVTVEGETGGMETYEVEYEGGVFENKSEKGGNDAGRGKRDGFLLRRIEGNDTYAVNAQAMPGTFKRATDAFKRMDMVTVEQYENSKKGKPEAKVETEVQAPAETTQAQRDAEFTQEQIIEEAPSETTQAERDAEFTQEQIIEEAPATTDEATAILDDIETTVASNFGAGYAYANQDSKGRDTYSMKFSQQHDKLRSEQRGKKKPTTVRVTAQPKKEVSDKTGFLGLGKKNVISEAQEGGVTIQSQSREDIKGNNLPAARGAQEITTAIFIPDSKVEGLTAEQKENVYKAAEQKSLKELNSVLTNLGDTKNKDSYGIQAELKNNVQQGKQTDVKTRKVTFPSEPGPLSLVTEQDKIDINSLIDTIVENDEKVWFWTADQLGRGEYGDVVVDKQHYLDAGPSYALDPENRKKGIIWASGLSKNALQRGVDNSDYIFIMSGAPQASQMFNKQVFNVLEERVNQAGGFSAFKKAVMKSKPVKAVREIMAKHDSFDSLKSSTDRKKLLSAFASVEKKKDTPLKRTLEKFNAFLDMDSMRDSFYRDNDFKQNDVMIVLKPTGVGEKSAHSTYTTDILGEVVGVPDVVIDAADIATGDARAKIDSIVEQKGKRRSIESQVIAPYGTGPGKKVRKAPKKKVKKTEVKKKPAVDTDVKTQVIGEQVDVETYISEQKFFQDNSPFAWAVDEVGKETLQDSQIREYKGTFGVVTPDGDIKGLFNPNVARERQGKVAEKGTLRGLMPLLIEAGGNKLDNFDGRLTKLYEDQGFRVVSRTPFNEEFAPEGWNKKDHGTPDVVAMVYDPEGKINIEEKTFDEYDDAMAYRDEVIDSPIKTPAIEGDVKTQKIMSTNDRLRTLGRQYNMNNDGFTPSYINLAAFQNAARKLGFGVKKARGPRGGYYFTRNGSKVNVMQDMTKTQIFDKGMSVDDVIKFGRENNFTDAMIKDYLVRIKKMKAKEVNGLLSLDADMFRRMPAVFGDIKGGAKAGMKLFKKVLNFNEKLKKRKTKLTEAEMMDATIDFMEKQPEFQAEGDTKTIDSQKQMEMIVGLQKAMQVNPTKNMNTRIRGLRKSIQDRKRGAKNLQKVKAQLRNFIRQTLPSVKGGTYTRSELMSFVRKVTNANESNINNIMDEVFDFVTKRQVKTLDAKIESILNGKYEVIQSGRKKGVKIDNATRKRLAAIKEVVTDDAATADDIIKSNESLNEMFRALAEKVDQTEQDRNDMIDLMVVMSINNSKLMDDTNVNKVESLSRAEEMLSGIIGEGRQNFKEELKAAHEKYTEQFRKVFKDVTGRDVDVNDPDVVNEINDATADLKRSAEATKANDNKVVKFIKSLNPKNIFVKSESIEGLMERIAEAPGVLLGGNARKLVYDGLNEGIRGYKKRMMDIKKVTGDKLKEVYGKKWRKTNKDNSVKQVVEGIYTDPEAVKKAQDAYDANPTKKNKKALQKVKQDKSVILSKNQVGYLYMQLQDPANTPAFENMESLLGKDYKRTMDELVEWAGKDVIALAEWQMNEFYPSLYPGINDAYKDIYRTDLPWNENYGGRIYREGEVIAPLDMLGEKGRGPAAQSQISAASTKVRQARSKPIMPVDMMNALVTYSQDMQWFANVGPTIRDINKLFTNPLMRKAITNAKGEVTMDMIDHAIKNIANRGLQSEKGNQFVNSMNNLFATTRLGISPNIAIKQLTSIPTYALDIGAGNYLYYAVKNKTEFLKVFNEIRENSVYLQDRLSTDIRQSIEAYSASGLDANNPASGAFTKGAGSFFTNLMMGFVKAGDITAIYLGGMPNYSYYKAEFKKNNPTATDQDAIEYAVRKFETDTKSTQQSMDVTDKDYFQTSSPFNRALNMFKTSPKQYLRKEMSGLRNMRRGFRDKNLKQFAGGLNKFLMYHVMMPMGFQFVASGMGLAGWDDEDNKDLARAAILGNFNSLFIVGDILQSISNTLAGRTYGKDVGTLPVFDAFGEINEQYLRWNKLKDPKKKEEAFIRMSTRIGELALGGKIPLYNITRFYKNIEKAGDARTSEEVILRLLNYSDYVVEGGVKSTPGQKRKTTRQKEEERRSTRDRNKGYRR